MKTATDYLSEANETVPKLSADDAVALYNAGGAVFVDVRDSAAIADSGTIAGAERIPRGMMEFVADPGMAAFYNDKLQKDAKIALICGAGGQAALAGKTLQDMGYTDVVNIGGFKDWVAAGGAVEAG